MNEKFKLQTWMNLKNMLSEKKRFTKVYVPYDSIPFMWNSRTGRAILIESTSVLPRAQGEIDCKGVRRTFWGSRNICILIGMVVEWVYSFVKVHQSTHLKWMRFIAGKFTLKVYLKIWKTGCRGIRKVFFHLYKV